MSSRAKGNPQWSFPAANENMDKLDKTSRQASFWTKSKPADREALETMESQALQLLSAAGRHCLNRCQIPASTNEDTGMALKVEAYRVIHAEKEISETT